MKAVFTECILLVSVGWMLHVEIPVLSCPVAVTVRRFVIFVFRIRIPVGRTAFVVATNRGKNPGS